MGVERERERTENRSLEGLHGLLLEVLEALILHLLVQRLDVEGHLQRHRRKRQGVSQGCRDGGMREGGRDWYCCAYTSNQSAYYGSAEQVKH